MTKVWMDKVWILTFAMVALAVLMISNLAAANLVSLAYDDGTAEDGIWINSPVGHGVVFTAPCDNWTLSGIDIFGELAPKPQADVFVIEVWNQNFSLLSRTTDVARDYFGDNFTWSSVDIPDVKVSGNFLICLYEFSGIYQGVDVAPASKRSVLVARNPNRILNWTLKNRSWNETNWMIRAVGYSPEPKLSLKVLTDTASQSSPAKIQVKAQDPDGNLKRATLYIIDNKTKEVSWSQLLELKGGSADVQLSWPGTAFQINANGLANGPVFAINNVGVPDNLSAIIAYSTPVMLELEKNKTASATAYFGEDGKLNAIINSIGTAYYISGDLLNKTRPGTNYMQYIKGNTTLVKDKSKISFIKVRIPPGQQEQTAIIGPVTISSSPLFNYGISLKKVGAGMGEYVAIVQVEDSAFNAIRDAGNKPIKVI